MIKYQKTKLIFKKQKWFNLTYSIAIYLFILQLSNCRFIQSGKNNGNALKAVHKEKADPPQILILGESYLYSYNGSEQNLVEFKIIDKNGINKISVNGKTAKMGGVKERHLNIPALPGRVINIWAENVRGEKTEKISYLVQGSNYFHRKYSIK